MPQFGFRAFKKVLAAGGQVLPAAIDIEGKHGKCRTVRMSFATFAAFGRTL
jgi:hypothetical protein